MKLPIEPTGSNPSHAPFLPVATAWCLKAARPLALALHDAAPQLGSLSFAHIQAIGSIEQLQSETAADRADLILNIITEKLAGIDQLFTALQLTLVLTGRHVESRAKAVLDPTNPQKSAKAKECAFQATMSQDAVRNLMTELELELPLWMVPNQAYQHPADILEACLTIIEQLQGKWLEHTIKYQSLQMKLQTQAIYLSAAQCLGVIVDLGLRDILTIKPPLRAQHDVIAALEESKEYPCSASWPEFSQLNSMSNPSFQNGEL